MKSCALFPSGVRASILRLLLALVSIFPHGGEASPFFLPDNPFQFANEKGSRSPCPGLNTLANHGLINRNGSGVLIEDVAVAGERVFGLHREYMRGVAEVILELALKAHNKSHNNSSEFVFDLVDLYKHSASLALKASLFRSSLGAPFNETLFQALVKNAVDGYITFEDIVEAQVERIYEARLQNPYDTFHDESASLFNESVVVPLVKENIALMACGQHPSFQTVKAEFLRKFIEDNEIPHDFIPRKERGLDPVKYSDPVISTKVLSQGRMIKTAIANPLVSGMTGPGDTEKVHYPSKTKSTSLLAVFESFCLFMKDLGQGKILTYIADRPLNAFLEGIASAVLNWTPQFYTGTNGASQINVKDKRSRYHLVLQPKPWTPSQSQKTQLPVPSTLFDQLFQRRVFIPEQRVGANMLLATFANWFLDEIFSTEPNTLGALRRFGTTKEKDACPALSGGGGLHMAQLYGTDEQKAQALRSFRNGKMKTNIVGGLPSLSQIRQDFPDFSMT